MTNQDGTDPEARAAGRKSGPRLDPILVQISGSDHRDRRNRGDARPAKTALGARRRTGEGLDREWQVCVLAPVPRKSGSDEAAAAPGGRCGGPRQWAAADCERYRSHVRSRPADTELESRGNARSRCVNSARGGLEPMASWRRCVAVCRFWWLFDEELAHPGGTVNLFRCLQIMTPAG